MAKATGSKNRVPACIAMLALALVATIATADEPIWGIGCVDIGGSAVDVTVSNLGSVPLHANVSVQVLSVLGTTWGMATIDVQPGSSGRAHVSFSRPVLAVLAVRVAQ